MTRNYKAKNKILTHEELKDFLSTALGIAIMKHRQLYIDAWFKSLPGQGRGLIFVPRNAGRTQANKMVENVRNLSNDRKRKAD